MEKMKNFLFIIWLRGQSRPNTFTVAGHTIADATCRLFSSFAEPIHSDEVERMEVYP